MYIVFIILTVIISILLIGIVLIQKSKGGGLSSQFGGGNQVLGVRGTNSFLEKTTWSLAGLILVLSVCTAYTMPKAGDGQTVRAISTEAPAPTPQPNTFATDVEQKAAPAAQSQATAAETGASQTK